MNARVLMIDNYDSFTYNLVQALRVLGADVEVFRNDEITVDDARRREPSHVVISPGPGGPRDAGVSMPMIDGMLGRAAILGVCLGHQAMAEVLGGSVARAPRLMHGKPSQVFHDGLGVYAGLSNPFEAGRYHSLAVVHGTLPACLVPTAHTAEGEIMGIRHTRWGAEGVQFHPESVLTPEGNRLLANFLRARETGGAA